MRFGQSRSLRPLVLLLAALLGCGDGAATDVAGSPTPSATRTPPATHTVAPTASRTPTAPTPAPTAAPVDTASATATQTPTGTATPTLAIPTGTATATLTPSVADPCAGPAVVSGSRRLSLESRGRQRSVMLITPDAPAGEALPLVLLYHGSNGDGATILFTSGFDAAALERRFLVAAADGIGRSWNSGFSLGADPAAGVDDVGFTRDLVDAIRAEYCVDPARVYATGFSKGAAMVFRLACEASDRLAAFAPLAGALTVTPCEPAQPRPIRIINNVADPRVPFALGELSFEQFLAHSGCEAARETVVLGPTASCELAPHCAAGVTTSLCAVEGVAHQWPGGATDPGGTFNATDAVCDFFALRRVE